jgi:Tol biopolymer transport system component
MPSKTKHRPRIGVPWRTVKQERAGDTRYNRDYLQAVKDAGGEPVQVTDGNGSNEYPSWSPDGRYLAFSSTRSHNSRIYIMMVGNRKIISALTEGNGNDSCPAWSGWLGE